MYYPYKRNKAGNFRMQHKTAKISEYLLADAHIISLAKDVLKNQEYSEAEDLADMLIGTKQEKDFARQRLMEVVKPPPKRPVYYAQREIKDLPHWTRDALRYLGDFIDLLVKCAVYEKNQDKRVFNYSLGPAIDQFRKHWANSQELVDFLKRYNCFLYRGAKHDFTLPAGRIKHRFTAREVVLTAYVTMNLASRITSLSPLADRVRQDKPIIQP